MILSSLRSHTEFSVKHCLWGLKPATLEVDSGSRKERAKKKMGCETAAIENERCIMVGKVAEYAPNFDRARKICSYYRYSWSITADDLPGKDEEL
jgi:hypothetical protein